MNQFNLVRQLGYEISDEERSSYYWKVKHDRWVAACRAQEGEVKEAVKEILRFGAKVLWKCLYGLLWGFTRLMWAWCWCLDKLFDGILYTKKRLDTWHVMH